MLSYQPIKKYSGNSAIFVGVIVGMTKAKLTPQLRKQILIRFGSCYVWLKRGHRTFECLTKKT